MAMTITQRLKRLVASEGSADEVKDELRQRLNQLVDDGAVTPISVANRTGISRQMIHTYRHGQSSISTDKALSIAQVLKV